jgi:CHAD domain-containing protein
MTVAQGATAKPARTAVTTRGDRLWSEAAERTLADLTAEVRKRAKDLHGVVDVEPVHDMRTATRRLRTAITIYAQEASKRDRKAVEDQLRRVARRLGSVRDLDVLLETLAKASSVSGDGIESDDLAPLRKAWEAERKAAARRLEAEIGRRRSRRALDRAEQLVKGLDRSSKEGGRASHVVYRVADRAPSLIWAAFGEVLAYDLDPLTADPAVIHEMRIAAKKFRYTLEAFESALQPGATLIEQTTALQDGGGEMHDAIVARDRARSTVDMAALPRSERVAIEAFAKAQGERAEGCRPVVARYLANVRGRAFRGSIGRALAAMGHVTTNS